MANRVLALAFLSHTFHKVVAGRSGITHPSVIFETEGGNQIQYIDYGAGKTIRVKGKGDSAFTQVMHWGVKSGSNAMGRPEYTLNWFKRLAQAGDNVTQIAREFCDQVGLAQRDAFDSDEGVLFLGEVAAQNAENRANGSIVPKAEQEQTGFAAMLAVGGSHRACAKNATTVDEYLSNYAANKAKREAKAAGVSLDMSALTW